MFVPKKKKRKLMYKRFVMCDASTRVHAMSTREKSYVPSNASLRCCSRLIICEYPKRRIYFKKLSSINIIVKYLHVKIFQWYCIIVALKYQISITAWSIVFHLQNDHSFLILARCIANNSLVLPDGTMDGHYSWSSEFDSKSHPSPSVGLSLSTQLCIINANFLMNYHSFSRFLTVDEIKKDFFQFFDRLFIIEVMLPQHMC